MKPDKESMVNVLKSTIDMLLGSMDDMRRDAEREMNSAEDTATQITTFFRYANVIQEISNALDRAGMMH